MLDKLVEFLLNFIQLFYVSYTVLSYQEGIVLRFGKFHRMAKPGFGWKWPFSIEEVFTTGIVDEPMQIGPLSLITADGKDVVVSAIFLTRVNDVKKFLLEMEGGNAAILLMSHGALAELVQKHSLAELCAQEPDDEEDEESEEESKRRRKSPTISKKLAGLLRRRVTRKYGVDVPKAQITELAQASSFRLWGIHDGSGGLTVK